MSLPELNEITVDALPPASLSQLQRMREDQQASKQTANFKLHPAQRFLRRILSPDAPTRSLLLFHGTGVGKTCTAVQVAEEYILRPEFQDKKVMVVSSASVSANFQTTLFNMSRVHVDEASGTLESKQCTGRRYLDMLMRIEGEPRNWKDPAVRDKLQRTAKRITDEFYEFMGYISFGNLIREKLSGPEADIDKAWIHKQFDNRLLIIDEAHNIRFSEKEGPSTAKTITDGLSRLVKVADGLVLVLLSATPMYDSYEEIVFYMNLFGWNDRTQDANMERKASDYFEGDGTLKSGKQKEFEEWCNKYVSYVRGDSPFTFPFRLPPPRIADPRAIETAYDGGELKDKDRLQYMTLVADDVVPDGPQEAILQAQKGTSGDDRLYMLPTLCVLPTGTKFGENFRKAESGKWEYRGERFLAPDLLASYSTKFASVIASIQQGEGIVFVYSNYVELGIQLFAMALEEQGYTSFFGKGLLDAPPQEKRGSYVMLTAEMAQDVKTVMTRVNDPANKDGSKIKVILAGPIAAEGLDFRCVRQVHVLDPWWNASRLEQVIGRGLRNGSHASLPFSKQNCSVYLHVCRTANEKETYDEYVYRTKVERKAVAIAKVRKLMSASALDCPSFLAINTLPDEWKNLPVPQERSEGQEQVTYTLREMMPPTFLEDPDVKECGFPTKPVDTDHVRPLSTYLDVRDELLDTLQQLLIDKPIWNRKELFAVLMKRKYSRDVIVYNLQHAIRMKHVFRDSFGRRAFLESKGDVYALATDGQSDQTLLERTTATKGTQPVAIPVEEKEAPPEEVAITREEFDTRRAQYKWPGDAATRFGQDILDSFLFDHALSEPERRSVLSQGGWGLKFVERLRLGDRWIRGAGGKGVDVVTHPEHEGTLNGEEAEAWDEWKKSLWSRVTADPLLPLTSTSGGKFKMSSLDDPEVLRRNPANKRPYDLLTCGTGKMNQGNTKLIAVGLDSKGVGVGKTARSDMICVYAELLAREEHNCIWLTPEEASILSASPPPKKK